MGERGAANHPATPDDMDEMAAIVTSDPRGRARLHHHPNPAPQVEVWRAGSGDRWSSPTSCYAIVAAMQGVGHGVFQFAPEHPDPRRTGVAVDARVGEPLRADGEREIPPRSPTRSPDLWREVLVKLDEAHRRPHPDRRPGPRSNPVGLLMCLEGSYHPLMFHPAYDEIRAASLAEQVCGPAPDGTPSAIVC